MDDLEAGQLVELFDPGFDIVAGFALTLGNRFEVNLFDHFLLGGDGAFGYL